MENETQLQLRQLGDQVVEGITRAADLPHDASHDMLLTMAAAISAGVILLALAHRLNLPAIVLLVAGGVALGPEGFGLVQPAVLGDGLRVIVALAIGLILFEGGLTLDVRGYRSASSMIQRLLTVGVLTTGLSTALAIWLVFDFPFAFCLLAASLVVVTGPTVIAPLLKRIKVQAKMHNILHWEGVLIDPIGVFIAILCFEWIDVQDHEQVLLRFLLRFVWGLGLGIVGGVLVYLLIRIRLIVDEMLNVFSLAAAVLIFGIAESFLPEAGLLAVTASGFVLGILGPGQLKQIRHFKAEITDLLIGTLFILLVARLDLAQFVAFGTQGALLVAVVVLVARPLNILNSSWGLNFNWREKVFLSWVAPRGIVAASMASLFAINLQEKGTFPQAPFLETFTYSIIISTVVLQGFSAGLLAWALGLKRPPLKGWLIVGAHALGRRLAHYINAEGKCQTVLIDTNPAAVEEARKEGLTALLGDGREVDPEGGDGALQEVGNLLALTDNSDLNILLCQRWAAHLGKDKVFFWSSVQADRGKFTGTAIWPSLPKPSALSGELERGEAQLAPLEENGQADPIPATALLSIRREQIELNPVPKQGRDALKTSLFLTRKTDYLTSSLKAELILELEEDNLETLFAALVRHVADQAPALPQEQTVSDLLQREKAFPTVLGHGIASPHAYSESIATPLCALARLPRGVDFGSPEGEAIRLVFLLLSPPHMPQIHLEILAAISRLISRSDIRTQLLNAEGIQDLAQTVHQGTLPQA